MSSFRRWLAVVAAVAIVGALGWWAGRATLGSSAPPQQQVATVLATVTEASVGRSLSITATVRKPFKVVAYNALPGVVTSVDVSEGSVHSGSVLYTVDALPVVAVDGTYPFYRDLAIGSSGKDVAQLQRVLVALGHYHGRVTGRFGAGTASAVRAWQRKLGISATGRVPYGAVLAVPHLPAPVRLGEQIVRGARLAGNELAVSAATGEVSFALVVSEAQAALIPPDATVVVTHGEHNWPAVLVDSSVGPDGSVSFTLGAPDGGRVCADSCADLPNQERISLRAEVTLVPPAAGPAVPLAAVHTDPQGHAYVLLADGTRRDVTVRAASGGIVVVAGVTVGERVQVSGTATDR